MLNSVVLMGRLTADPELRTTGSGTSVCRFSLAVERSYAPQGQERKTDFIDCVAWRQTAEFISKYFRKGKMIAVEGQLQQVKWVDDDGNTHAKHEVSCSNCSFCGDRQEDAAPVAAPPAQRQAPTSESYGQQRARQLAEEGKPAEPAPVSMEDLIAEQDLPC